jgi:hypothetical protein
MPQTNKGIKLASEKAKQKMVDMESHPSQLVAGKQSKAATKV